MFALAILITKLFTTMKRTILFIPLFILFFSFIDAQPFYYPKTKKIDNIDTYFGTKISDPYQWMEDQDKRRCT